MFRHHRTDDAGEKNHDDHPVQHVFIHQEDTRFQFNLRTDHHHRQSTGSMGIAQTEQHLTGSLRHAIDELGEPGSYPLGNRCNNDHDENHLDGLTPMEQGTQVDEHPHPNQEVRDEKRITHKLRTVHQRRNVRNQAVQHQASQESTEDTFHACQLRQRRRKEHQGKHKNILHHIVFVGTEEPTGKSRKDQEYEDTIAHTLADEPYP